MSKWLTILIIVVVILSALIVIRSSKESTHQLDNQTIVPIEGKASATPPVEWHEFQSESGHFSIQLPTNPQYATETLVDEEGKSSKKYEMYLAETPGGAIFTINLITYNEDADMRDVEALTDDVIKDILSMHPDNKLVSSTKGSFQGHPSIDAVIVGKDLEIACRAFLADKTYYFLSFLAKKGTFNDTEYHQFVDSFTLTPKVKS